MDNDKIIIKGVMTSGNVLDAVANVTGVSRKRILSDSRQWPAVEARMLSVLVLNWLGLPDIKIAWILNRQRPTVCKSRHAALNLLDCSITFKDKYLKLQTIINNINPQQNES